MGVACCKPAGEDELPVAQRNPSLSAVGPDGMDKVPLTEEEKKVA